MTTVFYFPPICCILYGHHQFDQLKYKYKPYIVKHILCEIRKRKANWIGLILHRNCLLKQVIEGKIKGELEVESYVETAF